MADVRVALVTGSSRRIGAAIARHLHQMNFNIIVHYNKSMDHALDLVQELNRIRSNSAFEIQADLKTNIHNTADQLIQQAQQKWKRLDVLVNNAAIFEETTVGQVSEHAWDNIMETNLKSPFFISQAAYPFLKAHNGSIVNIIDINAYRPMTNHSVYCISKAGLQTATLALAKDFAPHVRVNGVSPGAILWPEGNSNYNSTFKDSIISKIPMNRPGDSDDMAGAVGYLVNAGYVTGHIIDVDGGWTLNQ